MEKLKGVKALRAPIAIRGNEKRMVSELSDLHQRVAVPLRPDYL